MIPSDFRAISRSTPDAATARPLRPARTSAYAADAAANQRPFASVSQADLLRRGRYADEAMALPRNSHHSVYRALIAVLTIVSPPSSTEKGINT